MLLGFLKLTRGKKPTTAIDEAKSCAEKMGYRWCRNTDPEFPFDAFIFRDAVIAVVKVKKSGTPLMTKSRQKKFSRKRSKPCEPCRCRHMFSASSG